jgi:hypothetical protein
VLNYGRSCGRVGRLTSGSVLQVLSKNALYLYSYYRSNSYILLYLPAVVRSMFVLLVSGTGTLYDTTVVAEVAAINEL